MYLKRPIFSLLKRGFRLQSIGNKMMSTAPSQKGILLGFYSDEKASKANITGTEQFNKFNEAAQGSLINSLQLHKNLPAGNCSLTITSSEDGTSAYALSSAGNKFDAKHNHAQCLDQNKDNVRRAVAAGIGQLNELDLEEIVVDCFDDPRSAAEGAFLASWKYKSKENEKLIKKMLPLQPTDDVMLDWNRGKIDANAQNFARFLMESPANIMTPTNFANTVKEKLLSCETNGEITVDIMDGDWIRNENMNAFLSVTQGSDEPPKFLKISYMNASSDQKPFILVGKGVTFDSGGISIKPSQGMDEMRADMGGAAVVCSSILAAAEHNVQDNIIVLVPLCENMVNGKATRPGDVVVARNNKSIQINNTDAEGRLLLADALSYACDLKPRAIIDMATLTGAIVVALGASSSAVFTNDDSIWEGLNKAGSVSGDRVWRMPLFEYFKSQVTPSQLADVDNVGNAGRAGGSCTAAAFLREFVDDDIPWAHIDIAGVMTNKTEVPYLGKGMSGRPTRTIVEFLRSLK